jgi:hypothetical protein
MNKERKSLSRFVEEGDEAKIKEMEKYEGKERRFCKVRKGGDFFFFFLKKIIVFWFFFFFL